MPDSPDILLSEIAKMESDLGFDRWMLERIASGEEPYSAAHGRRIAAGRYCKKIRRAELSIDWMRLEYYRQKNR